MNQRNTLKNYLEEKLHTKINRDYEVAICGGGFAGISAALAAARQGKRTILIERQFILGGLGTSGLITIYLPLCDGCGHQVTFGIAEELFHLSILHGAEGKYPDNWLDGNGSRGVSDNRYEVQYNPHIFAILVEQLLRSNGVDILYGTSVVNVNIEKDKIKHIITENKTGRSAYEIKSVVDATGDCDVAKLSGIPTITFEQGNTIAGWYYSYDKKDYCLNMIGLAEMIQEENMADSTFDKKFIGLDGKEISEYVYLSHRTTYNDFLLKREINKEFIPVTIATIPQLRMTRKIVGEYELSDKETHKYFPDSVGMISNWRKRGPIYEVPFRTLYNRKVKNLICAGRCTSVNVPMWDIMRVIPCCAVTGQAAGTAAAITDNFSTLDINLLQSKLRSNGVVIHENDIIKKEFKNNSNLVKEQ